MPDEIIFTQPGDPLKTHTTSNILRIGVLLMSLLVPAGLLADGLKSYTPAAGSTLSVDGTSTLHAWTMNAKVIQIMASAALKGSDLSSLKGLTVTVPLANLVSHDAGMDKNMQAAMKAKEFPNVTYVVTGAQISGNTVTLSGDLSFAGATKPLSVTATATPAGSGVTLAGSVNFAMSTWGVKPPVMMLGTIKVGDNVVVKFNLTLQP